MRDEVELFGGPEAIFGCRHVAADGEALPAGVVVCSSVGPDAPASYGAEARLGRALARAGVATQRFHYRGTGASDGAPADLSFPGMVVDARAALDRLRTSLGSSAAIGIVGVRLGTLVAARLAASLDGAPVVLWSPVADARHVLEAAARARAGQHPVLDRGPAPDIAVGFDAELDPWPAGSGPARHLDRDVDRDVDLDLFDLPLAAELIDGVVVGSLVDELRACSGDVLLVQTTAGPAATGRARSLVEQCRARGLAVDAATLTHHHEQDDGVPTPIDDAGPLVDHTASWLVARLSAAPSTTAGSSAAPTSAGGGEATP